MKQLLRRIAERIREPQQRRGISMIITPVLGEFQISVFCGMIESSREHRQ